MAFRYAKSPSPLLEEGASIGRYQEEEARRLAGVIQTLFEGILGLKYNPPPRHVEGQIVIADGVKWNPGGEGRPGIYLLDDGEIYQVLTRKVGWSRPHMGKVVFRGTVCVASPQAKMGKVIFKGRPQ